MLDFGHEECTDVGRAGGKGASLARMTACVAELNANVVEVHHQRHFTSLAVQQVEIDIVLKTRNREHVEEIVGALRRCGFNARAYD